MNRRPTLLVAILVLLAGCTAFTPAPATDTPTPTPTPAFTGELAPGITGDGIVNPVALLGAHQRELLDGGFVTEQTVVSTYQGEVSNRLTMRTAVGPAGELASQTGTSRATNDDGTESVITNDVWLNTTAQITRHVEEETTTYQVFPRLTPPESLVWFGTVQGDIQFAADEYAVTAVEHRDGVRFVTLEVSYDRVGGDGVDDAFGRILVDERGVIHHATMNVSYDEGTVYRTTYDVVALGAAPSPPAWLDDVPASAALNVGLDVFNVTETSVELVHTYGDAVPAGSVVTVETDGTRYETTLADPFDEGARYLWLDADGTLRATATPPAPGEAQALATEVIVTVRAPDGGELFSLGVGR